MIKAEFHDNMLKRTSEINCEWDNRYECMLNSDEFGNKLELFIMSRIADKISDGIVREILKDGKYVNKMKKAYYRYLKNGGNK